MYVFRGLKMVKLSLTMLTILFIIAHLQTEKQDEEKPEPTFKQLNKWEQYSSWAKSFTRGKNDK